MRIEVHHYHHVDMSGPNATIDRFEATFSLLEKLISKVTTMSQSITNVAEALTVLKGDVTNLTSVVTSSQAAFQGVTAQLAAALQQAADAGATPEQLQGFRDLHSGLVQETDALTSAIVANTPAAGTTAPATGT